MDLALTEGASIVGDDGIQPAPLWAIRLLAASAFGVCLYLSWTALQLSGPVGCGAAAGCAEVLGSRWSKWLGVPVSAPAATVYLSILIASFWIGRGRSATARRRATAIVAAAALVAGGAAIWFVYLQAAVVEQVCPYCLAAHACGILIAVLLLLNLRVAAPRFTWTTPALAGAVGVSILVAGQFIVKPQTYQVDVAGSAAEPACLPSEALVSNAEVVERQLPAAIGYGTAPHGTIPYGTGERPLSYATQASYVGPAPAALPAAPAVASFHLPGAWFDLQPSKVPCVGSQAAQHFILMISDYACPHCRATHHVVSQTLRRYDGQISLLVLPIPLDRRCNPQLLETEGTPEPQDCALNRLALAVWCADSAAYEQMDAWLFAADRSRLEDEARNYATLLVGATPLRKAETDRRIDAVLRLDTQLYARAKAGALPKLLLGSTLISGRLEDSQPLEDAIEREWRLQPTR